WNANNALFDTLEAQLDRQQTESRGTTRILTQSGTSSTPATAATTRCTVALPCRRAEDRDTEQTLDRLAVDFDKLVHGNGWSQSLLYGAAWQRRSIDFSAIDYRWNNAGTLYQTCTRGVCTTRNGYAYTTLLNVGQVEVKGVELDAQFKLGDAWLLRAAWTHNQGELEDGRPLDSINPDRGVLGLSWEGLDERLRITANITHAL
ncbi:TonB-dependent receptor, partial [Xanthomonas hortorum pv. carotae]|nr:TonB-dependent receptor [Xanthomonas hortorum pv. carotae]